MQGVTMQGGYERTGENFSLKGPLIRKTHTAPTRNVVMRRTRKNVRAALESLVSFTGAFCTKNVLQ